MRIDGTLFGGRLGQRLSSVEILLPNLIDWLESGENDGRPIPSRYSSRALGNGITNRLGDMLPVGCAPIEPKDLIAAGRENNLASHQFWFRKEKIEDAEDEGCYSTVEAHQALSTP